jgi:hypothetical protein
MAQTLNPKQDSIPGEQHHLHSAQSHSAKETGFSEHRLVLGTHTSESEQNFLMLAKVCAHLAQGIKTSPLPNICISKPYSPFPYIDAQK